VALYFQATARRLVGNESSLWSMRLVAYALTLVLGALLIAAVLVLRR
jgi:hypothetical protein